METFTVYTNIIIAIYLIVFSLIVDTKNFGSSLIFKVIPFFSGIILLFTAAKLAGWILF